MGKIIMTLGILGITCSVKGQSIPDSKHREHIISIEFNKNIEFLGYALHIGEPGEEPSEDHPLRQALDEKRSLLKNEESLLKTFELGAELSYSLFVELFARMDELPHEREYPIPADILQNNLLHTPADLVLVQEIMKQVNLFYQVSEFDAFWEFSQPWRVKALEEISGIKPDDTLIETMEAFYEQKFSSYEIIPSLTFWSGPGFAFKAKSDQGTRAYMVIGPFTDDYHFDLEGRLETMAIHEFGHSFVNHILEETCQDLIQETRSLFDPISEAMSAQGYPEWSYCVNEHFVRAGEILIPEIMHDTTLSESHLTWNTEKKEFIYLRFIVDRLRTYRIEEGLSYRRAVRKSMSDLEKKFVP